MRRTTVVAIVLAGLGVAGIPVEPVAAQSRVVVVPIIIQPQRAAPPTSAGRQSVQVTTTTASPQPGVTTTRITVQDTTGRLLGVSPAPRMTVGTDPRGQTQVTVADGPTLVVPVPVTLQAATGGGHQTVTITSDGPIDVPIVFLTE